MKSLKEILSALGLMMIFIVCLSVLWFPLILLTYQSRMQDKIAYENASKDLLAIIGQRWDDLFCAPRRGY